MKRPIRVLPAEVVDQIAAGEVVERPASVIKELVENALDAESTEIRVRASGGGVTLIEVGDNGYGMEEDEAQEALKRHATSKISRIQDLGTLRSLGFRGEALSSIAAVCRLEIVTRTAESTEGTRVLVEGGRLTEITPWGCPVGTRVRVEDLFFNIPARRKFLRSRATEAHHLKEILERMAVVCPEVAVHYEYEGRKILDCPPVRTTRERIRQLWRKDAIDHLHPVCYQDGGLTVEGLLSHPNIHRNTASRIWLYVNGRPVQDRGLLHAVLRGYGVLMERGRYPVGVLQIGAFPQEVDVNVHPTKREVRFRQPERVQDGVVAAVRRLLREQPWAASLGGPLRRRQLDAEAEQGPRGIAESIPAFSTLRARAGRRDSMQGVIFERAKGEAPDWQTRFLGQVGGVYLVFTTPEGLLLLDQHAAHERVIYEQLQSQMSSDDGGRGQGLLLEEVVELSALQAEALARWRETLERLGWRLEPFGGMSWRIRAIPVWMDPAQASRSILDILEACGAQQGLEEGEEAQQRVLAQMACHGALRGGRPMGESEAIALLQRMRQTPARGLCPHGRPTLLEISLKELDKRFGRS